MRTNSTIFLLGTLAISATLSLGCGGGDTSGSSSTGGTGGTTASGGTGGNTGGTGGATTGGTGGTTTGGTGGTTAEWAVPACTTITGTDAVTFTLDEGATLAPTEGTLQGIGYTYGLAALDTPSTLLAEHKGDLLRSEDAGCTWSKTGKLEGGLFRLQAARGGLAYAWEENGAAFYRIEDGAPQLLSTPAQNIVGLGVDPANGLHLRVGDSTGTLHDSTDGGATWSKQGAVPVQGGTLGYRYAFDPADLDHALFGQSTDGAWVTKDGGKIWSKSAGLGANGANAFSIVVSPADTNLVWVESLEIGPDTRHIYRSTDGGASFDVVVTESADVTLINGTLLAPHPENPDVLYFIFGSNYADYGTDLYRYDHASGKVTKTHNAYDEISSIVPSPADPKVLYLGLTVENGGM